MALKIQILVGLTSLGVINLLYFLYMTRNPGSEKFKPCAMDTYIRGLTLFVENNGKLQFSESFSNGCLGKASENVNMMIRNSVLKAIQKCSVANTKRVWSLQPDDEILTLFTSWSPDPSKFHVHNNTVINWSTFMPRVNLVLFTNDSSLSSYVEGRGWITYPIIHQAAGGAPVLKHMFQTVIKHFNSTFYGYANSDILFDSSLIETLSTAHSKFENRKSILITGRRTNVKFLTLKEAASYGNILNAAKTRGTLFEDDAEDFFIANKMFNWTIIPELVIGRRAYDNWLVLRALEVGAITVDVTRTLLALHQTTNGGDFEGHKHSDPDYNANLILKLKLDSNYGHGRTSCMEYETYQSLCDETEITKRLHVPRYCKKGS